MGTRNGDIHLCPHFHFRLPASCSRSTPMICASLNLLFFTSVSLGDGLSLKSRDQEGGRSIVVQWARSWLWWPPALFSAKPLKGAYNAPTLGACVRSCFGASITERASV